MSRLDQLQKLLTREPNDAFLNFALAMELAKGNRVPESLAQFDRVVEIDPNYAAAYFQKGQTLVQSGDIIAAKAVLQTGISRASAAGDEHAAAEMSELLASL